MMIKLDIQDKEVPGSWFQREVNVIDKLGRGAMIHARWDDSFLCLVHVFQNMLHHPDAV